MEQKFKADEIVYERVRPLQKLVVRNYDGLLYYCIPQEQNHRKALVFFERELMTKNYRVGIESDTHQHTSRV